MLLFVFHSKGLSTYEDILERLPTPTNAVMGSYLRFYGNRLSFKAPTKLLVLADPSWSRKYLVCMEYKWLRCGGSYCVRRRNFCQRRLLQVTVKKTTYLYSWRNTDFNWLNRAFQRIQHRSSTRRMESGSGQAHCIGTLSF